MSRCCNAIRPRSGYHALDPDTIAVPGHLGRGAARRRRRGRGHRRGARRQPRQRLLRGAPARPPCRPRRPAMGFCFVNNVGVGVRTRSTCTASSASRSSTSMCTTATAPRTSSPVDERVLMTSFFQHPLYPYSGHRLPWTTWSTCPSRPPTAPRARGDRRIWMPRLDDVPAADDLHLGRLRRAPRGRSRPARPGRGRLRLDHPAPDGRGRRHCGGRIVSLEGGYNLGALARSVEAMCACWRNCEGAPRPCRLDRPHDAAPDEYAQGITGVPYPGPPARMTAAYCG